MFADPTPVPSRFGDRSGPDPRCLHSRARGRTRRSRGVRRPAAALGVLVLALAFGACEDDPTEPEDRVVEGVNLTALFAPPSELEINAVLADWSGRDPTPSGPDSVRTETTIGRTLAGTEGEIQVVRLTVDGVRHWGAIQRAFGASDGSQPILLLAHGGDNGFSIDDIDLVTTALGDMADDFVIVAPAFRGEPLRAAGEVYSADEERSPWDRDVDDALAFIELAGDRFSQADPERLVALGFSRGGGVALLTGIRSVAVDQVIEFFGPTDMFSSWVEELVASALRGVVLDLPGLATLNEQVIQPLRRGEIGMAEARLELVRRSSVLFAGRLPPTQVHHGALDPIVPVGQAESLIGVMEDLGREPPSFEGYIYPTGTHDPFSLPGAIGRALDALSRVLEPALAGL